MMSFLRRLALKSVMAAKKESVAKCAGPLQYGVGRPDGANTMIKTMQYLPEADNSRVLVALDPQSGLPKCVSQRNAVQHCANRCGSCSCLLQVVHQHHGAQDASTILPTQKSVPTAELDQGCPLSTCGFSAAVDPVLRSVLTELCTHYDLGAKLFAYLDDCVPVDQTTVPSTDNRCHHSRYQISQPCSNSPPKHKYGKALAKTPFHRSSKTRSGSHLVVWEDIYKFMEILNPALSFWGEQATMEKTIQRFQKIATTLADLNAEGTQCARQ